MAKKPRPAVGPNPSDEKDEEEEEVEEEVEEEEYSDDDDDDDDDDEDEEDDEEEAPSNDTENKNATPAYEEEEEEIDPSDRDSIRKLIEPFGKDQLMEILTEAALKNPSLLSLLSISSASDTAPRKIFVHGLGWDATSQALAAVFNSFGHIEECKTVIDRSSGRCKGYGFVLFRSAAAARRALKEPQKRVGNRTVSCQLASQGSAGAQEIVPEATGRKIYVNDVPATATPDRLRAFFSRFGEIEVGPLGLDPATGQMKGFAIFVYKTAEGCRRALEEPKKVFDGCELMCSAALEGLKPKNSAPSPASAGAVPAIQHSDLALTYASQSILGLSPVAGLLGQGLNPAAAAMGLLGQNAGVGLLSPAVAGVAGVAATPSLSMTTTLPYGAGLRLGGGASGINSFSPSVMGSYASQVAMQGLGGFPGNQLPSTTSRSQHSIGSLGHGLPPYQGR